MKQLLSLFDKYSFSPKVGKRLGESSSKIFFMGLLLTALLCKTQSIYAQQDTAITVTGTVTDSQGVPLPGVIRRSTRHVSPFHDVGCCVV